MDGSTEDSWSRLRPVAGGFPPAAFDFVLDGLSHTVRALHGDAVADEMASGSATPEDESRHVSGKDLCLGLREFAIRRYGRLARTVLHRWNIHSTDDFGRIVFAMIQVERMRKTDRDRFEDFCNVFDFEEAFGDLSLSA